MRKTKIVCTIGPGSESEEVLTAMALAGMNVARLNFSHDSHEEHGRRIERIKAVREKLDLPIAIMLDTKGPEYRIKTFRGGSAVLRDGQDFVFTTEDVEGDESRVSVSYAGLPAELAPGDRILLSDGLIELSVEEISETEIKCRVIAGGIVSDRKSMNFPGKVLKTDFLSDQDKKDILYGIEQDVDYIACSFVSTARDMKDIKDFLEAEGVSGLEAPELIAKIENRSGVDNIKEICRYCDGLMVARGDLGVELRPEELPPIQKHLITVGRLLGKKVITATEMLESMIEKSRPTRAEVSDVANAVYDGTSAVMLSGETAMGKYPVKAVDTMAKIALKTEQNINYGRRFKDMRYTAADITDAVSHAACSLAIDIDAKFITCCTFSGLTAAMISRFRPPVDILGLTPEEKTARKMALSWGVIPVKIREMADNDELFEIARKKSIEYGDLQKGDNFVITGGMTTGVSGKTNVLKAESVE